MFDFSAGDVIDVGLGAQPAWQPQPSDAPTVTASPAAEDGLEPAVATATAVATVNGFQTPEEAIAAYASAWLAPFLGDCDVLEEPSLGSCLAGDRKLGESEATYRLCRVGVGACLNVVLVRPSDGPWSLSSVTRYGEGPTSTGVLVP